VTKSVTAIVPLRHSSRRVPGKNYRPLAGIPLYRHIVRSLLDARHVAQVVIDTDSALILEDAAEAFPEIVLYERPSSFCGEMLNANDILANTLRQVTTAEDTILQTHSTNPLLRSGTIDRAIEALSDSPEHDCLLSVTPIRKRYWTSDGRPLNHDHRTLLRTQDLPPLLEENSCIYLFDRYQFLRSGSRIGERPLLFPMDPAEALDIDTEFDLKLVESVYAMTAVA
jgi:CMP-N-acetylneuraminic acid synthetase